jgi:Tfp pilus assembly pilus retraction ATPase PilT
MSDRETIDIALKAAESSHLMLSTLHIVPAVEITRNTLAIRDSQHEREGGSLRADVDAESPHTLPGGG